MPINLQIAYVRAGEATARTMASAPIPVNLQENGASDPTAAMSAATMAQMGRVSRAGRGPFRFYGGGTPPETAPGAHALGASTSPKRHP